MDEGNRYRAGRMARGLSQEDLSAACGVDARTIRKLEQGQTVSARTVRLVTAALGMDPTPDMAGYAGSDRSHGLQTERASSLGEDAIRLDSDRTAIPGPHGPVGASRRMPKTNVVSNVVFSTALALGGVVFIVFLVNQSKKIDEAIVALRSEVSAEIAYPAEGVRIQSVVDDLKSRQTEIGYRIVEGRRGAIEGRDGSSKTMGVSLAPLGCPVDVPCDEARKAAVFSDFSRRMLDEGGATTVTRQ